MDETLTQLAKSNPVGKCLRFLRPDYPGYEKFAKLTRQEEDWGLLEDPLQPSHRKT